MMDIVRLAGAVIGATNIAVISPALAEDFELEDHHCILFRRDDITMMRFECTATHFSENVKPLFVKSIREFKHGSRNLPFKGWDGNVVVLHTKDQSAIESINDIFDQLSSHFKDFKFALIGASELPIVRNFTRLPFGDLITDLAIVDFDRGCFYNVSSAFPSEAKAQSFNASLWGRLIIPLLHSVRDGNVSKIYRSEPIPPAANSSLLRVVALNYNETVLNETNDVFILFLKRKCSESSKLFQIYRNLSKVIGNGSLVFGFIDTSQNQIENGFPVSVIPSVLLYPRNNKTTPKILPYHSSTFLAWFAVRYANGKHSHQIALPDESEVASAAVRAREISRELGPALAAVLKEELSDLAADINLSKANTTRPSPAPSPPPLPSPPSADL
jgi:hypothetical protein